MKIFVIFILLLASSVLSAFDLLDEDTLFSETEPYFETEEYQSDQSMPEKDWHSTFESFNRFNDKNDTYKIINKIGTQFNNFDAKFLYVGENINPKSQFGGNITYQKVPENRLIIGQFQIQHAYGLLISKSSFITPKPGFNTNYNHNRTILSNSTKPFMSNSFFGVAYQKKILENLTLFTFSSYKKTGISSNGKLNLFETDPNEKTNLSFSGLLLNLNLTDLHISGNINYTQISSVSPITASTAISYQFYNLLTFSESAISNSKLANVSGVKYQYQNFVQMLTFRHIQPDYHADFSNYLRNFGSGENEQGLFYKIVYNNKKISIQTFADIFSNIENHERYNDKNHGVTWGVQLDKYSLLNMDDMSISASYREKQDKEWRNFVGKTRLENRIRQYYRLAWQQIDNNNLTTKITYDFQVKQYPEFQMRSEGYIISSNITLKIKKSKFNLILGTYECMMPVYLYLYSGKLNNPVYILNGEGNFAMLHLTTQLLKNCQLELMGNIIKKEKVEHGASMRLYIPLSYK